MGHAMKPTYELKPMQEWSDVAADVAITDPPFGIDFDGKAGNYNRDESRVVDGYVEWQEGEYREQMDALLSVLSDNLHDEGQALIFSGWNNSHLTHEACLESDMTLEGKLYWAYNFAPYCKRRPAHNVYEVFWLVKGNDWYYSNECESSHCTDGEANLSMLDIPRDYQKDIPKYPTRLPEEVASVLIDHFTQEGDHVFDPCAGSGMVGSVACNKGRSATLGDLNEEGKRVFERIEAEIFNR